MVGSVSDPFTQHSIGLDSQPILAKVMSMERNVLFVLLYVADSVFHSSRYCQFKLLPEMYQLYMWDVKMLFSFFQDLIVDQTIEKVSFCAPDRNYDKAFSYICRDGTTRRWMCHCFMALKDSVRGGRRKLFLSFSLSEFILQLIFWFLKPLQSFCLLLCFTNLNFKLIELKKNKKQNFLSSVNLIN